MDNESLGWQVRPYQPEELAVVEAAIARRQRPHGENWDYDRDLDAAIDNLLLLTEEDDEA